MSSSPHVIKNCGLFLRQENLICTNGNVTGVVPNSKIWLLSTHLVTKPKNSVFQRIDSDEAFMQPVQCEQSTVVLFVIAVKRKNSVCLAQSILTG